MRTSVVGTQLKDRSPILEVKKAFWKDNGVRESKDCQTERKEYGRDPEPMAVVGSQWATLSRYT